MTVDRYRGNPHEIDPRHRQGIHLDHEYRRARYTLTGRVLVAVTYAVAALVVLAFVYGMISGLLWLGFQLSLLIDRVLDALGRGW